MKRTGVRKINLAEGAIRASMKKSFDELDDAAKERVTASFEKRKGRGMIRSSEQLGDKAEYIEMEIPVESRFRARRRPRFHPNVVVGEMDNAS